MRLAFTPSHPDFLVMVPDYDPDFGLADTTRAGVMALILIDNRSVKEAAVQHRLGISTVYKWLHATKKGL